MSIKIKISKKILKIKTAPRYNLNVVPVITPSGVKTKIK